MEKIILLGAGGHAKTIVDTLVRQKQYEISGFIAPKKIGTEIYRGYTVIGDDLDLETLFQSGIRYVAVTIGYMGGANLREQLYQRLKEIGYLLPIICDNTAVIADGVQIGEGSYIGRNVVINAEAEIGKMCILNTASVVEHESIIGDFSHVAVGAVICGQVSVGRSVFVGANATVIQQIRVGNGAVIGAGAVVVKNIPERAVTLGNPARIIKIKMEGLE
jgi:sugar O-acyltransferase, sialic acid O-acetyltransferase neuD family